MTANTELIITENSWQTILQMGRVDRAKYTEFIMIYPTGLVGDLLIMYKALPMLKKGIFMQTSSPFSYYDFLWAVLWFYPFLWLKFYLQLFKQRKSKLGKAEKHQSKRKRM